MAGRVFGRVTVTTPDLDEPGLYLSVARTLDSPRGIVQDFTYGDVDLRSLTLTGIRLVTGRISEVRAKQVEFEAVDLHGVEITGSDLGPVRWSGSRLTRVHFRDCRLMGAVLDGLVLDDVLFENCRLDYATFEKVRVTGPVAFVGCALTEAVFTGCDLSGAVFPDCRLGLTAFGGGRYRDTDLGGSDLSQVRGVANLAGVRVGPGGPADLARALVDELGITVTDT
ncbi:pentapeptide repeat-containing protein [Streptomyces sudanensis]|uniref:pentapeptide repeat-containing protein n=1 Tax=Streptomyces sudanensis TaxID=436397 RepID=UPI0020CEE1C5|nr:pentapeptide repeat-containing protein [Streptomyces sudanensis]MCP9957885.1 pentapeptide repeat-containing protein [Streptomyces sudanensis]MCP9987014.1 pentapeptide repeat-containing protein [Streptomyces sudanensis]MCQ0001582.1 pentapeptide repeat-containing protein [Streptomyces sudanensis]